MNNNIISLLFRLRPVKIINTTSVTYATKEGSSVSMIGSAMKKKKLGKVGVTVEKKILPVETDPEKLVNYAIGVNILKEGEEVKLKPDNEYPDWLWEIRTDPAIPLEELDPDSKAYWRRIRKLGMKRNNKMNSLKRF